MTGAAPGIGSDFDSMGALLDEYANAERCHRGDIVEGVIASVGPTSILVDIGGKSDAIVHPREVEKMPAKDLGALRPGQTVNVYVLDAEDDDGAMVVSLARAAQQSDWERAKRLLRSKEAVQLTVVDANKGGVIVRLGRLRGFVPGSQLLPSWRPQQNSEDPDHRWHSLLGKTLNLCVIEVTPERNRLIFSEREASHGTNSKAEILQSLQVGQVERGTVSNIVPFGAFINVKGVDGLLHISELSWKRVNHPREVLEVGQSLEVYVLDVDLEQERLGLSLKRLVPDPWADLDQVYAEGQLVEVSIVNLTSFGAFAALCEHPEIEGLIHISELAPQTVERPGDVVRIGERRTVRVISLRPDERRIAFSLKQAETEAIVEPPSDERREV